MWLSTHGEPTTMLPRTRSAAELHRRQAQLEALFSTAPPDHRELIAALIEGQLVLDDLGQALDRAGVAQTERREWILEHWPHIVEHAEITRTLNTFAHGPELGPLLDHLAVLDLTDAEPTAPQVSLASAARTNQAWLRTTLGRLVPPDTDQLPPPTIQLLGDIATYRDRWNVTHPAPLGLAADAEDQATELADLAQNLSAALDALVASLPGREQEQAVQQLEL
jgi:hypothetical protein